MKSRLIRIGVVAFWVLMMAWLIRFEAFPHYFEHRIGGYRHLLANGPIIMDSWMKILFNEAHIGYSHTQVDINEKNPNEQFYMRNQTVMDMVVMGDKQSVGATAEAMLDQSYRLQRFTFVMSADRYVMRIEGRRADKETFNVTMRSPAGQETFQIELPDDVILYSPLTEMSMQDLKIGHELTMRTLDPSTMSLADVTVKAVRRETVDFRGEKVEVTVLSTEYQGMEVFSWMDQEGHFLRQETPFGWIMESCPPSEAVAFRKHSDKQPDMLRALSVPVKGELPGPRKSSELVLLLDGLQISPEELSTGRQTAERADDGRTRLVSRKGEIPAVGDAAIDETTAKYLEPSAFIQSDNDLIKARAAEITANLMSPVQKAIAINDWVYENVGKDSESSLPSAVDVLHTMRGDCNEHTYLYVALARAAGIPSRVCIGIVFLEGAFYYHAWPAVYTGTWWELDPTFGQHDVDATHIFLLEGEHASQLRLLGVIGQIEAEVVSVKH